MFNVGDRVVCIKGPDPGYDGREGIVHLVQPALYTSNGPILHVQFDGETTVREWYHTRFELIGVNTIPYFLVCRKIKQMEERWARFQERKYEQSLPLL